MKPTKKTYTKPDVMMVDFSMASSVAASCAHTGNLSDGNTCSYEDNGWKIFIEGGNGGCDFHIGDDFCDHVPTADTNVFNS